jgi:transcription factor TFIIIB component B''
VNSLADYSNLSENLGHVAEQSLDVIVDHNTEHVNSEHESTKEGEREVYFSLDSFDDLHPQSIAVEVDDLNRSTRTSETNAEPENETTTLQDPLTRGEATITANERDIHLENVQFETQESQAFPSLNTQDFISAPTITSGGRTEKFQPVPKARMHKEKNSGATVNEEQAVESVDLGDDYSYSYQWDTSQPENINHDDDVPAGPEFPPPLIDDLDFSAPIVGLDKSMPSNLHQKENSVPESVLEMPDNGTSRYSRRERKNIQLVDEPEDEVGDDADPTFDYVNEEAEVADDEAPKKKREKKNSKKAGVNDKEEKKTVRKRKKGNEDESKEPPPPKKKFSHSTRRNRRRQVDKTLLETPEEDIDYKKLKIRDLIIFAEYKERIEKRDSVATQTTTMNQSVANPSAKRYTEEDGYGWDPHGTDEYGDEHREEDREEEEAQHVEENISTTYFNYQTHMEKTPVTRWSKQDTLKFYEGIKQFGTDMSMIQLLFPGKSRRQIKLKYKKEERRDPMRLHEAVLNRASDNSQFDLVIERLNKIAAEEEKLNRELDGSDELVAEEPAHEISPKADDNVNVNVHEELPKSDKVEEEIVEEIEVEKQEDSDDDMLRWSQYNSEF